MRTTLTIDDDVAAALERLRSSRNAALKEIINEALRRGLQEMAAPARRGEPYRTPSVSLGRCLLGSLGDVAEVLALAERETFP